MIVVNCEQNSPEWYQVRLGVPTASKFGEILTASGERSKSRTKYLYRLAGEIITGKMHESFQSHHFERGHEVEPLSRQYYELLNGVEVEQVGFCFKDERRLFGASPDGLVGPCGGFETKAALPHVQAERLAEGWTGAEHHRQVMGNLYVTGREWWDLVSFCPNMQPVIIRFERDDSFFEKLEKELDSFCLDLKSLVEKIK